MLGSSCSRLWFRILTSDLGRHTPVGGLVGKFREVETRATMTMVFRTLGYGKFEFFWRGRAVWLVGYRMYGDIGLNSDFCGASTLAICT